MYTTLICSTITVAVRPFLHGKLHHALLKHYFTRAQCITKWSPYRVLTSTKLHKQYGLSWLLLFLINNSMAKKFYFRESANARCSIIRKENRHGWQVKVQTISCTIDQCLRTPQKSSRLSSLNFFNFVSIEKAFYFYIDRARLLICGNFSPSILF